MGREALQFIDVIAKRLPIFGAQPRCPQMYRINPLEWLVNKVGVGGMGRKALQIIDVIAKVRVGGRCRKALRFIDEIMPTSDLGLGGGGGGGWKGGVGFAKENTKGNLPQ